MLKPENVKSKKLKRLVAKGDEKGIRADWRGKVKRILYALHVAVSPEELDIPSYGFHQMKGDRKETYSIFVSRNWRITFKWDDNGPYDIDLEDYHD